MIKISKDYDLTKLNTFGIKAKASLFVEINSEEELKELFNLKEFQEQERLFLGGGSNVLFTKDFEGIVILNKLKGIEIINETSEYVFIKSMGGEWWNDLVNFAVDRGYWGIENLALIPGTVGATPVQNIGAYGIELKDILENVEAYDVKTAEKKVFTNTECEFGYRDSVFKSRLKGKYFILAVVLKLNKNSNPNISYKFLKDYLMEKKLDETNIKNVNDAVAEIRRSKLPDPKILGNAGSFFKNVFVPVEKLKELLEIYPSMPYFEDGEMINPVISRPREHVSATVTLGRPASNRVKIPAGWLIEQCGWKGKRIGNVGVHERQALVLVNYGGATGEEIKNLAEQIIDSVYQKFGLKLTLEVNLI